MKHTIQICSREEALARLADGSLYDFLVSSADDLSARTIPVERLREANSLLGCGGAGENLKYLIRTVDLDAGGFALVRTSNLARKRILYRNINEVWVPRDAFDVWELAAEPDSRVLCTQATMNSFGRGTSLVKGLARMYDKVDWRESYDIYYWLGREMCWHVDGDRIEAMSVIDGMAQIRASVYLSEGERRKKRVLTKLFVDSCENPFALKTKNAGPETALHIAYCVL